MLVPLLLFAAFGNSSVALAQSGKVLPTTLKMVHTFYASFSDTTLLNKVMDENFVDHMPFNPSAPPGREGFRQTQAFYRTIFSDFSIDFKGIYQDGNRVIVHSVVSAKQTGQFLDIAPSGKKVSWNAIDIYSVKNNKLLEGWHVESFLTTYLSLKKAM
jgi:predicted ester cyclase